VNDADLFMVTIMVPDMDQAIDHYTQDWGFSLEADERHSSGHRWVELNPGDGARLRLAEARDEQESAAIGRQAGRSVAFFLRVGNFEQITRSWAQTAIKVLEPARDEAYGRVLVVADAFGNRWDVFDKDYVAAA
jgi:uncharacterized glyoxalase superfamily protein PhnB